LKRESSPTRCLICKGIRGSLAEISLTIFSINSYS